MGARRALTHALRRQSGSWGKSENCAPNPRGIPHAVRVPASGWSVYIMECQRPHGPRQAKHAGPAVLEHAALALSSSMLEREEELELDVNL